MITFSNGHAFEYMTASGALGFSGKGWWWEKPWRWVGLLDPKLFTSVTKTLTLFPTKGNWHLHKPWQSVRFIRGGVVNAVGLTNPGIYWWCRKIGPAVNSTRIPLVASIFGEPVELAEMAKALDQFDLIGLEINASCPNTGRDILRNTKAIIAGCEEVRRNSRLPLILKLSVAHNVTEIVRETEALVEAFSINSVPWVIAFPYQCSPLQNLGNGGVSGKAAQANTWALVRRLSELSPVPVIGPSVWDFADLNKVRYHGAQAISFGSIFLRYPWRPTLYARKDRLINESQV